MSHIHRVTLLNVIPENNNTNNTTEQSSNNSDNTGNFILGIGGLIVSGLGVYYQREAIMRTLGKAQKPQTNQPTPVECNTTAIDPPKPKVKCGIIKMK